MPRRVIANQHHVNICWVPGNSNTEGIVKSDELASAGSKKDKVLKHLLASLKHTLTMGYQRNNCSISRSLWPTLDMLKDPET